jgi:hypothetical protein
VLPGLNNLGPLTNVVGCPVGSAVLTLPPGQTAIAVPAGERPVNIVLGVGTQNYTCGATGKYSSVGAVAKLFDISCLYGKRAFTDIEDVFLGLPAPVRNTIINVASRTPLLVGDHYFVTNPVTGTGIAPKFAQKANGGAVFTVLTKVNGTAAPTGPPDVDFLQLKTIAGDWATTVFRVDTENGAPPASCTAGTPDISVPYAAKYWFLKP